MSFFKVNNAAIMKPHDCNFGPAMDAISCYDYVFAVNVRR